MEENNGEKNLTKKQDIPSYARPSTPPSQMNSVLTKGNSDSNESSITLKKSTMWKIATFVFAGLFLLSFFNIIGDGSPTGAAIADDPTPAPIPFTGNVKVSVDADDPILGNPDADISIVEFSDFQCPFCARAFSGALSDFKNSDYFKNGEVNLIYKHFPLNSIHPEAQKAAEASECAGNQGKFWEYHDTLFLNQNALDVASLKSYAKQLNLNQNDFDNCLDSGAKTSSVNSDLTVATTAGGRGTPYFVLVNGDGETQAISGAVPWSNFETAIKNLQ